MKISLITIHDIGNNYGSTLQSCALFRYIAKLGYDVELVDYRPQYKTIQSRLRAFFVNLLFVQDYLCRKRRFESYYRSLMKMTTTYKTFQELNKNPPKADVYMVGSDQVWNPSFPCGKDSAYYLGYVKSSNKLSYASSLGRVLDKVQLDELKRKVQDFARISVRENISRGQLASVGINAEYVLDPVFLISKSEYLQELIVPPCRKYLLVYAINKDALIDLVAQKIALERNLKIVLIGGFAKKIKCDIFYRSAGPKEFLGLIANADFVLTSSFHGTAFSLIFNKQFAVVHPEINSLRIEDLLSSTGLTERVIYAIEDYKVHRDTIEYATINTRLQLLVNHSKQYLQCCLDAFAKKLWSEKSQ